MAVYLSFPIVLKAGSQMLWNFHGLQARRARGREYEARREVGRDERDGERRQTTDDRRQRTENNFEMRIANRGWHRAWGMEYEVRGRRAEDFLSVVSGPWSVANKA
jgi:hypothetical protein